MDTLYFVCVIILIWVELFPSVYCNFFMIFHWSVSASSLVSLMTFNSKRLCPQHSINLCICNWLYIIHGHDMIDIKTKGLKALQDKKMSYHKWNPNVINPCNVFWFSSNLKPAVVLSGFWSFSIVKSFTISKM